MRHKMLTQRPRFCIGVMAKKGTLSQHFMTHVVPPLGYSALQVGCLCAKLKWHSVVVISIVAMNVMFIQLSEFNFAHGQPTCKALYRVLQNLCNKIPPTSLKLL